ALRLGVVQLADAERLCGGQAIETLELRAGDFVLRARTRHLGTQILEPQPRHRALQTRERLALPDLGTDFGDPGDATGDDAGDARIRATDDRARDPAGDRYGPYTHGGDLYHGALGGRRLGGAAGAQASAGEQRAQGDGQRGGYAGPRAGAHD